MRKKIFLFTIILLQGISTVSADASDGMHADNIHVKSWNHFADLVYQLHKKQISGKQITKTEKMGGYAHNPDYYREVTYVDKKNGRLLSRIQWENNNPDTIHSIEVFVYDKKGRMARDYSASYLPGYHNAPVQTLINIHNYYGGLHAYRQYDVSKDIIYEYCEGDFNGKRHQIRLFEDDLHATDPESRQLFSSAVYKACFGEIQSSIGKYIRPQ